MAGVLLIAHAPLASALLAVARHAYPDARVEALDVQPDTAPAHLAAHIQLALERLRDPDALVLTDVFGATPCNVAMRAADGHQVRVVAGVNVPMLWRVLCYQRLPVDELAERALDGARNGVLPVSTTAPQNQVTRAKEDDQVHAQHQQ